MLDQIILTSGWLDWRGARLSRKGGYADGREREGSPE
jgi:hypothetical protein